MLDIAILAALCAAPAILVAYFIRRLFVIRAANRRANRSHPEYHHAHDNWHDHEDDTFNGN